jgi:hypothetical protein
LISPGEYKFPPSARLIFQKQKDPTQISRLGQFCGNRREQPFQ